MTDQNLGIVRPGENDIPEIREHPENAVPANDMEIIKQRDDLAVAIHKSSMDPELKIRLAKFFDVHRQEMMRRKSYENSLHNRELVFRGFKADLPNIALEDFVVTEKFDMHESQTERRFISPTDPNMASYQRFFDEFDNVRSGIIDILNKATEHFNRSCQTLEEIEAISKDESITVDQRCLKAEPLMKDLIALHKGERGTLRRWY